MEHFVYSEYQLRYKNYPLYWFTPYGEWLYETYKKPGGTPDPERKTLKMIDQTILRIIHDYQVRNLLYWKDLFTEKQFEQEKLEPYKRVSQFVGPAKIISSPISFTDPKHRPLAAVEKNTEFLETHLDHLDSRLTVIHDDSYIDFGPDIGHFLAECPYDPEEDEPDDPRRYLSHYDYHIYFNETAIYGLSPYSIGTSFHGDFFNGGIANVTYLGLSKKLDDAIEVIMRKYMLYNKYYWRNNYSYEDFQKIVRNYKKTWKLN